MKALKAKILSRATDAILFATPFLLVPWTPRKAEVPLGDLFRLLGGAELGHGVLATSILLVEVKYIAQALLLRSSASRPASTSETLGRHAGLRTRHSNTLGVTSWVDVTLTIVTGFMVGALGGFGGALIGALATVLILLHVSIT
jgi:hypothetical protein